MAENVVYKIRLVVFESMILKPNACMTINLLSFIFPCTPDDECGNA